MGNGDGDGEEVVDGDGGDGKVVMVMGKRWLMVRLVVMGKS